MMLGEIIFDIITLKIFVEDYLLYTFFHSVHLPASHRPGRYTIS